MRLAHALSDPRNDLFGQLRRVDGEDENGNPRPPVRCFFRHQLALDAGFASHSHFTARFKSFFGCTPAALRRVATTAHIDELRKILTARPH